MVPGHLVIVGGSYIGLEFAQMFRRFGSEVTVIENGPRLIAREDEDVPPRSRRSSRAKASTFASAPTASFRPARRRVSPCVDCAARTRSSASHVLVAVGRRPNTDDLGLDRAGVADGQARLHRRSTTSCAPTSPGIWALGDCNGKGAFTHTSYNDFEIVAANLLDGEPRGSATASPPTRSTSIRRSGGRA